MAPQKSIDVCFLCVWSSVIATGLLTVIAAEEPAVSARIVTPEADRKEGGQVNMTCLAENLAQNHVVSWRLRGRGVLRWGRHTQNASQRLSFKTTESTDGATVMQDVSITDLQTADDGEYVCDVQERLGTNSYSSVASSLVMLSVLYFPREPFPICYPDGSMIVDPKTELNLRCSSGIGNPAVMMKVSQIGTTSNRYTWSSSYTSFTVLMSLDLTANDSDVEFNCTISSVSFPHTERSCTIGPIIVSGGTQPSTRHTTEPTTETLPYAPIRTATAVVIVGASAGGAAAFLLIIILIIICWRRGLCKISPTLQKPNTKRNSSPTDTGFTTDDNVNNSGPSFNEEGEPSTREESVHAPGMYRDPTQVHVTVNPASGPDTHSSSAPVQMAAKHDTAALYALPHKPSTEVQAKMKSPDPDQGTSEQFVDNTTATILKPVAKVLPISKPPAKPQPYKPNAQRADNCNDSTPKRQNPTRPLSTPPAHSDAITLGGSLDSGDDGVDENDHLLPGVEASHAAVSFPRQEQAVTGQSPESSNIVYAELDLQSGPSFGVNARPVLPSGDEPVVYASVVNATNV